MKKHDRSEHEVSARQVSMFSGVDRTFPLADVRSLPRPLSDHTLLVWQEMRELESPLISK